MARKNEVYVARKREVYVTEKREAHLAFIGQPRARKCKLCVAGNREFLACVQAPAGNSRVPSRANRMNR